MKHYTIEELYDRVDPITTLPRLEVMGFDVANASSAHAVSALLAPGRRKVAFLNAHCVNVAASSQNYACALRRTDVILPDGAGVEMAAKLSGQTLRENLNGTDLTPKLMKEAAKQGKRVYLFGGTTGTAEKAAQNIRKSIPDLQIVGTRDGFGGMVGAVEDINASGADILLVALGVPLQELWIDRHFDQLNVQVALGIGALFDFWAGNVARAPKLVQRSRLEWAWRLLMEPRRLAGRYLVGNLTFMARALRHRSREINTTDFAKRGLDLILSATALLLLSPVFLLTALAIRGESSGAPIFSQTRVGRDGKSFTLYKFRSMYKDAEARRAALEATSDRDGVCFKSKSDPRITKIGRILRRLSIDELPQIFNVLRGDMSIVGPRPGLPSEVAEYSSLALKRLEVKPGLTGLWQVSGRADIGFDQMIAMDLAYARSRSVMLDGLIIGLTVRAIVSGRGAY